MQRARVIYLVYNLLRYVNITVAKTQYEYECQKIQ